MTRLKNYRARVGNAHVAVESWSVDVPRSADGFVRMTLRGQATDTSTKRLGAMSTKDALAAVSFGGADIIVKGSARYCLEARKEIAMGQRIPEGWSVTLDFWFPKRPSMYRPPKPGEPGCLHFPSCGCAHVGRCEPGARPIERQG
jgi:hypothetical protein